MSEAKKSNFSFKDFKVNQCFLNFNNKIPNDLTINFTPSGKHYLKTGIFKLFIQVTINNNNDDLLIQIDTESIFKLDGNEEFIDKYFTVNAPAIVFPYIRSFISSLSVQSGHNPILIPTLNLIGIAEELRKNIKDIEAEE